MAQSRYASTEQTTNLNRVNRLISGPCTDQLRDVLRYHVPPSTFPHVIVQGSFNLPRLTATQRNLILPRGSGYTGNYDDMDFSLLYTLLRSICNIPPHSKGWGMHPDPTDRSLSANIERIRIAKNQCAHSSPTLSNVDFNKIWSTLRSAVMDIDSFLGNGNEYQKEVDFLRHETMDPLVKKHFKETVQKQAEGNKELQDSSNEVANESAEPENEKGSIPPQCIEELESSLEKTTITVQHSRGILVGCAEAGKTTLLKRLMGETQDAVEDIESTRGLEVHHHVFNIRNGCLEVSGDDRQQKAFIRVNMSDLNLDHNKKDRRVEADVSAADSNTNEESSGIQILYEREQDDSIIGNRTAPNEVPSGRKLVTTANSVHADAKATTTIPRELLLKILDEKEKVPTISMIDLAGQFAYYACHQIYITKRVFFILVLNVNQTFEDRVSTNENNQEGSIFSNWTYKDYVKFWINSIKTFGSSKAPVLIIATHAEEKSEEEIDAFFKEFWKAVPKEDRDWLRGVLVDSEYDVGLIKLNHTDMETLESIKTSIIKAATQKLNNTIEVPSTWALLEQLVREKGKEVMSYEEICDVNTKRLPLECQLENQEMISEFLKFFHDNGLLLWFQEGNVDDNYSKGKVVLDIQWFANAVNKLIADKNHIHKDCKRRYYTEWEFFNKTGKIDDKLVNALWKNESSYLDHKTEIMTYMEKLQMAVALQDNMPETGMSWYVPCMNKKVFKEDDSKENWEYSSILCFRFSSFAVFVYYRVVAYCMSFLKWSVSSDERSLYQTAAVFSYKNHTVTIAICENDIEVQVKRIKPSVIQANISVEIGKSVQIACENLTNTFHDEVHFDRGYKCQHIICDIDDRSFTLASDLANAKTGVVQCESCSKVHPINVEEILRFWEKRNAANISMQMASGPDLEDRSRYAKLGMATNDVLNQACRDILESEIPPSLVYNKVQLLPKKIQLYPEQERHLQDAQLCGYQNFDISLSYKLIRNVCSKIPKPTKGKWGGDNMPTAGEITVGDDIERIRLIRNNLSAHVCSASTTETEFSKTWSLLSDICQRLETVTGKKYLADLNYIQTLILKEKDKDDIIEKLRKEHDRETLEQIKSNTEDIIKMFQPQSTDASNYDYYS